MKKKVYIPEEIKVWILNILIVIFTIILAILTVDIILNMLYLIGVL